MKFTSEIKARKETGLTYIGGINISAKIIKNKKVSGYYTYIIYLAPYNQSGYNVCQFSTPECRLGCLATSGRAGMDILSGRNMVTKCRINKTKLFYEEREFFMDWMIAEMKRYQKKAKKDGYGFSARLNGTSDIDWKNIFHNGKNIFEIFPDVEFYDYTKSYEKINSNTVSNYHLTFSYTGRNKKQAIELLNSGNNVAMVFNTPKSKTRPLPVAWNGFKVIDGDITDDRIRDEKGIIVGLHWKHIANKENETKILNSQFVVKLNDIDCQF